MTDSFILAVGRGQRQRDITDPSTRGLVLRVTPKGAKTWLFRYKWRSEAVRLSLGSYPALSLVEARRMAHEYGNFIRRGIDPRKARDQTRPIRSSRLSVVGADDKHTIEFLAHEYMERHVRKRQKRPEYVMRVLNADILPEWRGRDARTIKAREVVELLDKVVDRGSPVMANRVAHILGQMFKFGIQRAIVDDSPVKLLCRPGGKERSRDRVLSDTELAAFLKHRHKTCRFTLMPHVLMVLLLTLQRRSELTLAQWSEFNFAACTWTIPASHSKNGRSHILPLCNWAIEELKVLKRRAGDSRFVLPNATGAGPIDTKYITRSVARCLKRFEKVGIASFTPHDLRRTGRTGLARLGVSNDVAERVLNHARDRLEGVYDVHTYVDEKRTALQKWEHHLASLSSDRRSTA